MQTNAALDRTLSLGICTWLAIVEQDADRLATPAAPPSAHCGKTSTSWPPTRARPADHDRQGARHPDVAVGVPEE